MKKETINAIILSAHNNDSVKALMSGRTDATDNDYLHALCTVRCQYLNGLLTQEQCAPKAVPTAISALSEAVTAHNELCKSDRLDALKELSKADPVGAFTAFMADQTVPGGLTVEQDGDTYSVVVPEESKLAMSFYDFLKVTRKDFEMRGLLDAAAIVADNIARVDCGLDSAFVTKATITESYRDLRSRMGWNLSAEDNTLNKTKVREQMSELAKMLTPKGFDEIRFINADYKFMIRAAIIAVDRANKPGEYQIRRESTLINYFFRALYTRYNKLAYNFQEKGVRAFEKGVRTQEKRKSDAAGKAGIPDATPVTVTEKKKTGVNPEFEATVAEMVSTSV